MAIALTNSVTISPGLAMRFAIRRIGCAVTSSIGASTKGFFCKIRPRSTFAIGLVYFLSKPLESAISSRVTLTTRLDLKTDWIASERSLNPNPSPFDRGSNRT